ncbi:TMEM175 family protein [Brevundimonas sp.]|uniref:TMEM175 family protein n=1 Tax=Brevundimonas sp. TaxID=1871086 RepID=UPI0025CDBE0B|nr:TMEM175 family protein [Brevundimonas sp.]
MTDAIAEALEKRIRPTETKRLDAFVDAAFAFAVSLLIIAGGEPPRSFEELMTALGRIPAFAMGFALIVMFWLGHRQFGRLAPRRDGVSVVLSLAIVFMALIYVFPLRMLTDAAAHFLSGGILPGGVTIDSYADLAGVYTVYGVGFAVLGVLYCLLYRHAARRSDQLGVAAEDLDDVRSWAGVWAIIALSGVVSALVAQVFPLHLFPGLPGFCYWLIPVGIFVLNRRKARPAGTSSEA